MMMNSNKFLLKDPINPEYRDLEVNQIKIYKIITKTIKNLNIPCQQKLLKISNMYKNLWKKNNK